MSGFQCNVCACRTVGRSLSRSDGMQVLFCGSCDMGVVASTPSDTSVFYGDGYYGGVEGGGFGYADYGYTAEHSLLWGRLLVETLAPSGRVLDIGCADGHLLNSLAGPYERYGVEVNAAAAAKAAAGGVHILSNDVYDPAVSRGGPFDVVTSIATFEHVPDLRAAVAVALDALGPRGVLLLEVPLISQTRDNREWLTSSFEHIFYPTEGGMSRLLDDLGVHWVGFESVIEGFGSTYIVAATHDRERFGEVRAIVAQMRQEHPEGLEKPALQLNIAYNLVHSFSVTRPRIAALPILLERASSAGLLRRLMELWAGDRYRVEHTTALAEAAGANAAWHEQQASNWRAAFDVLKRDTDNRERLHTEEIGRLGQMLTETRSA